MLPFALLAPIRVQTLEADRDFDHMQHALDRSDRMVRGILEATCMHQWDITLVQAWRCNLDGATTNEQPIAVYIVSQNFGFHWNSKS